jgi:2-oxoglutarate dehydrogenase E2 component (dihydrolipoamide succinyltransferase)
MPAAAKLLADNNLSAAAVAGTGKDGRVTKGDVLAAVAAPKAAPAAVAAPVAPLPLGERPEQRVPMTRLRARIAERLLKSTWLPSWICASVCKTVSRKNTA